MIQPIFPNKLKPGDEVRVVSPATSLSAIPTQQIAAAVSRMTQMGLSVSFAEHAKEVDEFISSSVESRVEDLHRAFADEKVKAIFTTLGGFNSNQLLEYLDYSLIARHPKILCGYSDITALACSIFAKTGLVSYSGPHFATFGMEKGFAYIDKYVRRCLMTDEPFEVSLSDFWSNDSWFSDQINRHFYPNEGYWVLQKGHAEGVCIGGNLCTLNLLQGTEFMPPLEGAVLLIEDDHLSNPFIFDRDLQSLLQLPGAGGLKGVMIGRFEKASGMRRPLLEQIIASKKRLKGIPVVANADFGHTTPMFTFPIGGNVRLQADDSGVLFQILSRKNSRIA